MQGLGVAREIPQQSRPYSSITMVWPVPAITITLIKKYGFKPTIKHREGVLSTDLNWELVAENRVLITDDSASQIIQ